ncbi:hypothetical protein [Streptomyces sp. NPDC003487]
MAAQGAADPVEQVRRQALRYGLAWRSWTRSATRDFGTRYVT